MAKTKIKSLLGSGSSGSLLTAPKAGGNTLSDLIKQNDKSRSKLAGAGVDDPTKENKPSALERIMGPLDALGTGVRGLAYNAVSDEDVDVLGEMGKALRGEERIEGADILDELGVDNKWAKMLGGFAVDMLLDPLTYVTLGFGSAAKSGGKAALQAAAKYGDDAIDVAKFAADIGKNSDEALEIIGILKKSGLVDDAGKFIAGSVTDLTKEASQALMTNLYKSFGTGGVKFAGIPLGGENALAGLGYKAKDAARALPGSKFIEQTFGMQGIPSEYVDLFREGNEGVNTLVKGLRSQVARNLKVNERVSQRFAKELADAIPDEAARTWASVAIGRQFGDDAPELANLVDAARAAFGDEEAYAKAIDEMVTFRSGLLGRARDNIETTLRQTAGLSDEQVAQAMRGIDIYDKRLQELYTAQKERGLLNLGVFGDDATGYLPGVGVDEIPDAQRGVLESIGVDPDALRPQNRPTKPFLQQQRNVEATTRKEFLTPEARVSGLTREGDEADALLTEFDLSKLGGVAQSKQGGRIVLKDFEDELARTLGNNEVATRMAKSLEGFFTDDEATKTALKTFDKVTNWWKRQATVMRFPAFSNRNFLSNKILMFQDGGLSIAGEKKSLDVLNRMLQYNLGKMDDVAKKALESEVDDLVRNGVLTSFEELSEQVGRGGGNKLTKALGEINTLVENQSRISAFHTFRNKGLGAAAAGEMVNKALFDYSDEVLSVFERNFIKRVTPFYKWSKSNLSKQARILLESPGRSAFIGHLMGSGEAATDYDKSVMPEWLRELNPIPTPLMRNGNPVMISTEGLFPQNDLELIGKIATGELNANDALSYLSPLLRTPLEIVMNKDVYYDEELTAYKGEKKRAPGYVEQFGDMANTVPGLREVWGIVADKLGIQERTADDGEAYYWMNAKAVKALKDFLPWMNQVSKYLGGADENKTVMDRISATGVKPIYYDSAQFAQNKAFSDRDALNDALLKAKDEGMIQPKSGISLDQLFGGK